VEYVPPGGGVDKAFRSYSGHLGTVPLTPTTMEEQMLRSRLIAAVTAGACALAMSAPAVAPAAHGAKSKARHCVKYKTYKKGGKTYKRCSRYSK
jgi:hypothetical protein